MVSDRPARADRRREPSLSGFERAGPSRNAFRDPGPFPPDRDRDHRREKSRGSGAVARPGRRISRHAVVAELCAGGVFATEPWMTGGAGGTRARRSPIEGLPADGPFFPLAEKLALFGQLVGDCVFLERRYLVDFVT